MSNTELWEQGWKKLFVMKKIVMFISLILFSFITFAQVSKTVNVSTAGTLSTLLTDNEKSTITSLTITGNIDAYDISLLNLQMRILEVLDLRNVNINAFSGYISSNKETFPANNFPKAAFKNNKSLKGIILPNSINSIGEQAFYYCQNLSSIEIPKSVYKIESNAFSGSNWLDIQPDGLVYAGNVLYKYKGIMPLNTNIEIKEGTLGIGAGAFYEISQLSSINLPSSIISIGSSAFEGCINLSSINIPNPNSLCEVGQYALNGVAWLGNQAEGLVFLGNVLYKFNGTILANSNVTVKNGVLGIGDGAFSYQGGLTSINLPNTIKNIGNEAFKSCSGLTSIAFPNSVTRIGEYAFSSCLFLKSIYIPSSVLSIEDGAFSELIRLMSIYSHIENPMILSSDHFRLTNNAYCTLYVPTGTTNKYIQASGWNYFLNIVEFDATTALKTSSSSDLGVDYSYFSKSIILKGIDKPFSIAIYNFSGKTCYLKKYLYSNQSINANSLPQGIYVVKITVNNEVISRKIQVF